MGKMNAKESIFWVIYAGFLLLLFLMSSTDLIIKEKKQEIYNVSVIIEDSKDDYYINYRKGMDQAAIDYNIDVSFITLYERNSVRQQEDMLMRELEDGVEAVVLAPVKEEDTALMLERLESSVPVILLNSQLSGTRVALNVSPDYFEAGKKMAEAITSRHSNKVPVFIFTEGLDYQSNRQLYDGLRNVLEGLAFEVTLVDRSNDYGYNTILEHVLTFSGQEKIMIALDTDTLLSIGEMINKDENRKPEIFLYGPGANLQILNLMDRGVIEGVFTTSQYDAGYLSMEKAVEVIENKIVLDDVLLGTYYLEKADIRKKEYEKMLYPID